MNIFEELQRGNLDVLKDKLMTLDSEFCFECDGCGRCCRNQDTILLTARDIYHIARSLHLTMEEVIRLYTEVYIGRNSKVPVVHLLSNGPNRTCPFLRDDRCIVHAAKPVVCALYPLGRIYIDGSGSARYFLQDTNCGKNTKRHTVRSWLNAFGIPEQDRFFLQWNQAIAEWGQLVRLAEERATDSALCQLIWNILQVWLYEKYDTSQDFMRQFDANMEQLDLLKRDIQAFVASLAT